MTDAFRPSALPIDELIPEILAHLRNSANLVIEAEPGAGKTTRVPASLLTLFSGDVLVLEPRRIAARLAARRVAWELREEVGRTVGYQVRFERVAGRETRLHFLTEGVLTRRMLSDPDLRGVDAVVLDEFHERHLETDLALALLHRLQKKRPDLRIIVMSATLDTAPLARFLDDCRVLRSGGRQFPLTIEHKPYSADPLPAQVRLALEQTLRDPEAGEVLVFLPGAAEIRRTQRACESFARTHRRALVPLYGDLSPAEQDRAVNAGPQPKVILSTNVAESSITVEGVRTVIDSGLARTASFSPWTGLPTLGVARISKAAARQRAGRAARTAPGRAIRLYTHADFQGRADFETPEILRSDLAQLCLALRALHIESPEQIRWLDHPPEAAVRNAEALLDLLLSGAEDATALTRLPLHPRLARMITEGARLHAGRSACMAAALLSSGERVEHTDVLAALDKPLGPLAERQYRELLRLVKPPAIEKAEDDALLKSMLVGFPDRVAQRRSGTNVMLANGTAAEIFGKSPAFDLMVALDAEHRTDNASPHIRLLARVEPEWLLDYFPEQVREETTVEWNRTAERVDSISRLLYGRLVLQQSTLPPPPEKAGPLLAEKALESGLASFVDAAALADLTGRLEFAGIEQPEIAGIFAEFCSSFRSFAELRSGGSGFIQLLEERFRERLHKRAPRSLQLKRGRPVKIHYEQGKTPWIASRLQDFFGMTETPRLGSEGVPVVLHLLAPNQRPVQTTTDLAGFWQRLYPQVRRELMRRYPRHSWPEDPMS